MPQRTEVVWRITTESDDERGHEKQGKKRENSKQTKDDKQEDNNTAAGTTQLNQTTSPKRTKKIKVDRDVLTARERTRRQSRLKVSC